MNRTFTTFGIFALCVMMLSPELFGQSRPRARDLGIPFDGTPGPLNAITDVKGVEVGYSTIIKGEGKLVVGSGPVRTGVTAVLPRGRQSIDPVFAAWFTLNGNGEMTGTTWVEESGFLEGPIMLTNTHSVGVVRDAVIEWQARKGPGSQDWSLPVVAETYDGYLNDISGFHVKKENVFEALDNSRSGPVAEGNVGGGTGMHTFEFKGGTGTSSGVIPKKYGGYTVGVLVQSNFGRRWQLKIAGVPVGKEMPEDAPFSGGKDLFSEQGSIIAVVATDAPLLSHQLKRIVKRVSLALGRMGSSATNGSGDIFIAFSTANPGVARADTALKTLQMIPNDFIDPLFSATVCATEEAIVNAMIAAETMTGVDGHRLVAIPHKRLQEVLKKYNRLVERN